MTAWSKYLQSEQDCELENCELENCELKNCELENCEPESWVLETLEEPRLKGNKDRRTSRLKPHQGLKPHRGLCHIKD